MKARIVVVVVLVAIAGVMAYLLFFKGETPKASSSEHGTNVSSSQTPPPFTDQQARKLEVLLVSQSKAEQAKALVPELHSSEWQSSELVPPGVTLHINESSFVAKDDGFYVNMRAEGARQETFVARMAYEEGEWLIAETTKGG